MKIMKDHEEELFFIPFMFCMVKALDRRQTLTDDELLHGPS